MPKARRAACRDKWDSIDCHGGSNSSTIAAAAVPFRFPSGYQQTACINFVPVEAAISEEWEKGYLVGEITEEQQQLMFGAVPQPQPPLRAVGIDIYAAWDHGGLVIGPEPLTIASSKHGAETDSSHFVSFDVYLDITLALYGQSRRTALAVGYPTPCQRLTQCDVHTTLDEVVAYLKER